MSETIIGRFEQVANRQPEAVAIRTLDETISYRQLDAESNRIANAIVGEFSNEQEYVGYVFNPCADAIKVLLGIMKAGKYPIFSGTPLKSVFEKFDPRLTIAGSDCLGKITGDMPVGQLSDLSSMNLGPSTFSPKISSPNAPAYVLLTFGSIDPFHPKAALHSHKGDLIISDYLGKKYGIDSDDVVSFLRTTNGGMHDILLALLNGAQLAPQAIKSPGVDGMPVKDLANWANQVGVTYLKTTASVFRFACTAKKEFTTVKFLDIGGEPIKDADTKKFNLYFSKSCILLGRYATTETHVATVKEIRNEENNGIQDQIKEVYARIGDEREAFPVGYPVGDNQIHIVGSNEDEVPNGEVGQIVIQGSGLAIQYVDDEELNQKKFRQFEGVKSFFTGDLGLIWNDGGLIHLGRGETKEVPAKAEA